MISKRNVLYLICIYFVFDVYTDTMNTYYLNITNNSKIVFINYKNVHSQSLLKRLISKVYQTTVKQALV